MPDELLKQFEARFITLANDINAYLNDDSVPMECYTQDIDDKLMNGLDELKELLANFKP
jgi:hypothetical protein